MNTEEFKKIQTPLKDEYRTNEEAAFITLKAKGNIGENISCKIDTGKAMVEAGLHPATGGSGMQACSGDMLLESLVACAGVTLAAVATSMGITINKGTVTAEGDLDFRGTLGVSKDVPVGFKAIRLTFQLDCNEDDEKIQKLLKLTEQYCVVYQTLRNGVAVEATMIKG
jgi:uncharacterized OsmC-like protein